MDTNLDPRLRPLLATFTVEAPAGDDAYPFLYFGRSSDFEVDFTKLVIRFQDDPSRRAKREIARAILDHDVYLGVEAMTLDEGTWCRFGEEFGYPKPHTEDAGDPEDEWDTPSPLRWRGRFLFVSFDDGSQEKHEASLRALHERQPIDQVVNYSANDLALDDAWEKWTIMRRPRPIPAPESGFDLGLCFFSSFDPYEAR